MATDGPAAVAADGSAKVPLESDVSRTQLCAAMSSVLAASYVKDPTPIYTEMHVLGDQLDALDTEIKALEKKRADLMEDRAPDKKRLAKVDAEIKLVRKQIAEKLGALAKSMKVELKPAAPAPKRTG